MIFRNVKIGAYFFPQLTDADEAFVTALLDGSPVTIPNSAIVVGNMAAGCLGIELIFTDEDYVDALFRANHTMYEYDIHYSGTIADCLDALSDINPDYLTKYFVD